MRDIELEENENRKLLPDRRRRRTFASAKRLKESAAEDGRRFPRTLRVNPKEQAPYAACLQILATVVMESFIARAIAGNE
jgi:hypothetical protein